MANVLLYKRRHEKQNCQIRGAGMQTLIPNNEGSLKMFQTTKGIAIATLLSILYLLVATDAFAVDADAALAMARQNNCFKCHAINRHKVGPAYQDVAAKYRGKDHAESVKRLIYHLTSGEKAKFPDGHEEDHLIVEEDHMIFPVKDLAQQTNLVEWILSLDGGQLAQESPPETSP